MIGASARNYSAASRLRSAQSGQLERRKRAGFFVLIALISSLLYVSPVMAADALNREQAIEIALQQNGGDGKVLGVTTIQNENGSTHYAVKLLTNGRVRIFKINKAP